MRKQIIKYISLRCAGWHCQTIKYLRTYADTLDIVGAQGLAPLPMVVNSRICVSPISMK